MGKKLAIIFPGIGYSVDKPLLYYSRKSLEKNGYEVVSVNYADLSKDSLFDRNSKKISRERLMAFLTKAGELVHTQLENIDFSGYEKIVFVTKSIGAVVGAIYAKQNGIAPYHIMITPLDYAFQFVDSESGSAFCGDVDPLVDADEIKHLCGEKSWDFHLFKGGNHSLETGDVDVDVKHLERYVSVLGECISNLEVSIYDFEITCRNQQTVKMSQYKNKVLLIVNTATGCGFTPQYQMLESIYKKYREQGFEILDFPCNQFANQAPGTESEIYSFCTSRYDISFEQFAKVCVNGDKETALFKYLKARKGFKGFDMSKTDSVYLARKLEAECPGYEHTSDIKWNFTKFLVNRHGHVIERFEPTTDLAEVEEAIRQLL